MGQVAALDHETPSAQQGVLVLYVSGLHLIPTGLGK